MYLKLPKNLSWSEVAVYFLGFFFLVSALAKSMDINYFASVVAKYEIKKLVALAPLVVAFELGLGLVFMLAIFTRGAAAISAVSLFCFSSIFAYGFNELGITDCGCFGNIEELSLPPIYTFFRNMVLFILSVFVFRKHKSRVVNTRKKMVLVFLLLLIFTWNLYRQLDIDNVYFPILKNEAVAETVLENFVPTNTDKEYLVFVFSPRCSHCWNETENVKLFKAKGVVDSIIAIVPPTGEQDIEFFWSNFSPNFKIKQVTADTIRRLAHVYPLAYFIRDDTVKNVMKREVPSPVTFARYYR